MPYYLKIVFMFYFSLKIKMSNYRLFINDNKYLDFTKNNDGLFSIIENKDKNTLTLLGKYYGSGTCLSYDGLGWFGYVDHTFNLKLKNPLKLTLYQEDNITEELQFEVDNLAQNFGLLKNIPVNGTHIKKIFYNDLHRFGSILPNKEELGNLIPLEIQGIEIQL
jgi:hypothetical protein